MAERRWLLHRFAPHSREIRKDSRRFAGFTQVVSQDSRQIRVRFAKIHEDSRVSHRLIRKIRTRFAGPSHSFTTFTNVNPCRRLVAVRVRRSACPFDMVRQHFSSSIRSGWAGQVGEGAHGLVRRCGASSLDVCRLVEATTRADGAAKVKSAPWSARYGKIIVLGRRQCRGSMTSNI